ALDFGCGRGRIAALLVQLGFDVVGLDLQPHPFWASVHKARFIVFSGDRFPLERSAFDLVTHFQVLMYVKDPGAHLREVHRILKHGGYVSFQVANRCCFRNLFAGRFGDTDFYRLYSQDELVSLLERSGFRIERIFSEIFYAPVFPHSINFLRRVLLARDFDIFDRDSLFVRLTPPRYRGAINVIARKV
ncbi:MAG: class I SAM-dependent methyltransferase, partial [candidate division NC10 bacterium]|nr:class I SAM-dependent methyltransferase [candidate division NC10 bacterium]